MSSVPIKITRFAAGPSGNPDQPIRLSFLYEGRGKDNEREGIELDLSLDSVKSIAIAIRNAISVTERAITSDKTFQQVLDEIMATAGGERVGG